MINRHTVTHLNTLDHEKFTGILLASWYLYWYCS